MKAITLPQFSDDDAMHMADVLEPDMRPADFIIRVHVADSAFLPSDANERRRVEANLHAGKILLIPP